MFAITVGCEGDCTVSQNQAKLSLMCLFVHRRVFVKDHVQPTSFLRRPSGRISQVVAKIIQGCSLLAFLGNLEHGVHGAVSDQSRG